jgi:hypothetical protein
MLVTRRGRQLILITHPEHARLSGELARGWGNERFQAPQLREALVLGAGHHDDGWAELDGLPVFSSEHGRPAHFLELPLEQTVGPYGRGVDGVYARDPAAGALVSLHWSGLYSTRWGLQGGEPLGHPLAVKVVAEQEERRVSALREAWGGRGRRSEFERQVWYAYELLQGLDVMSLGLCMVDLDELAGGEPIPLLGTLGRIDQPAGPRIVPTVPMAPGGPYPELTMRVVAPRTVTVDPYPFADGAGFETELTLRRLDDRRYASAEEAASAFHDAPPESVKIRLDPA